MSVETKDMYEEKEAAQKAVSVETEGRDEEAKDGGRAKKQDFLPQEGLPFLCKQSKNRLQRR
jgi:hypothetical protein